MNASNAGRPGPTLAKAYSEDVGLSVFPVTIDLEREVLKATPWKGAGKPGKCVLTPEMKILDCYEGDDDEEGFAAIVADAAERGL